MSFEEIVLRTWTEKDELRLKQDSIYLAFAGNKTEIPLRQIISVSIERDPKSKMRPGMIKICVAGSPDTFVRFSSFLSVGNSNNIKFPHALEYKDDAYRLRDYIIKYEAKAQDNAVQSSTATSAADEIKKFKGLFDLGIISKEEFDAKKKQLLGL